LQQESDLGWYGKLPSLGDFASRRLPAGFLEVWDEWLSGGIAAWRERDPESWLEDYLAGPSLRFLAMPGAVPGFSYGWTGVVMPSVDRVGRYFPLTLAQPLARIPTGSAGVRELLAWLQRLDDLALDALQDDWSVEHLESELERLGSFPHTTGDAQAMQIPSAPALLEFRLSADPASWLEALAGTSLLNTLESKVLWLCTDAAGQPLVRISTGLPREHDFTTLLRRIAPTLQPSQPTQASLS
jgi:type VI secretion system protein ImpM